MILYEKCTNFHSASNITFLFSKFPFFAYSKILCIPAILLVDSGIYIPFLPPKIQSLLRPSLLLNKKQFALSYSMLTT